MKHKLLLFSLIVCCFFYGFSTGSYQELKITTDKTEVSGKMKIFNQDGNYRVEILFTTPHGDSQVVKNRVVMLVLKNNPGRGYLLDEGRKIYREIDISKKTDDKAYTPADYKVRVLGKEKVNGYNTVHVRIKNKKARFEEELWTITDAGKLLDSNDRKLIYNRKDNMSKALAAKGVAGTTIRFVFPRQMKGGVPECPLSADLFRCFVSPQIETSARLDLVKAERNDNPQSLFSLRGFTKSSDISDGINLPRMENIMHGHAGQFMDLLQKQIVSPR